MPSYTEGEILLRVSTLAYINSSSLNLIKYLYITLYVFHFDTALR